MRYQLGQNIVTLLIELARKGIVNLTQEATTSSHAGEMKPPSPSVS
jgi:hypothetical protein